MTSQYSELTNSQWQAISVFFDLKRKRKVPIRSVVNALLYMVRAGCQWRNIPPNFPHWRAIYYYFEKWNKDGTMDRLNLALNKKDRESVGREALPSVLCIDSQSVKLSPMVFEDRGIDGNKKVNGRKRQLLVDVEGRILDVKVHAANLSDGLSAVDVAPKYHADSDRLEKVLGDAGYKGEFAEAVKKAGSIFECASKPETKKGFVPIAKRWVVERTISWTNYFGRLTKDYEYTVRSSKYWVFWGNITIILNRMLRQSTT